MKFTPRVEWLDTQFASYGNYEDSLVSMLFGLNFMSSKLYQLSSLEVTNTSLFIYIISFSYTYNVLRYYS